MATTLQERQTTTSATSTTNVVMANQAEPKKATASSLFDDDSDDDSILHFAAFSPSKARNAASTHVGKENKTAVTPSFSVVGEQTEPPATTTIKRELTPKEILAKAEKEVASMNFVLIKTSTTPSELGWYHYRSKGHDLYYPVRRCTPQEYNLLYDDGTLTKIKTQHLVVYRQLGVCGQGTGQYAYCKPNQFVPLFTTTTTEEEEDQQDKHQDERLRTYLKELVRAQCTPLQQKVEELAIRQMWYRVQDQEEERKKVEEALQLKRDAELQKAPEQTSLAHHPAALTQPTENDMTTSDDDDDSIPDMDFSPTKRKPIRLRDGDQIVYRHPVRPNEWLSATILGISHKRKDYPLYLSTGDLLDKNDSFIRRTHRMYRNKLIPDDGNNHHQLISCFQLLKCGTTEIRYCDQAKHKSMKQHCDEMEQDTNDFWRKQKTPTPRPKGGEQREHSDDDGSERETPASEVAVAVEASSRKRQSEDSDAFLTEENRAKQKRRRSKSTSKAAKNRKPSTPVSQNNVQKKETRASRIESMQKALNELIENDHKKSQQSRRFRPHMPASQLRTVLRVWHFISKQTEKEPEDALMSICKKMAVSHFKTTQIMEGDKEGKVSERQIGEIVTSLAQWCNRQEGSELL